MIVLSKKIPILAFNNIACQSRNFLTELCCNTIISFDPYLIHIIFICYVYNSETHTICVSVRRWNIIWKTLKKKMNSYLKKLRGSSWRTFSKQRPFDSSYGKNFQKDFQLFKKNTSVHVCLSDCACVCVCACVCACMRVCGQQQHG